MESSMESSLERRFPCGPSTMVVTDLSEIPVENIYYCGQLEAYYQDEQKSGGAKVSLVNVVMLLLAFIAVAGASDPVLDSIV